MNELEDWPSICAIDVLINIKQKKKTYVFWDHTKLFHDYYDRQSKLHHFDHTVSPNHPVKVLSHRPAPGKSNLNHIRMA